MIETQLL